MALIFPEYRGVKPSAVEPGAIFVCYSHGEAKPYLAFARGGDRLCLSLKDFKGSFVEVETAGMGMAYVLNSTWRFALTPPVPGRVDDKTKDARGQIAFVGGDPLLIGAYRDSGISMLANLNTFTLVERDTATHPLAEWRIEVLEPQSATWAPLF